MQVPCHCQHAPWHLGANVMSFSHHLIEDPTHHMVMSRPLGATNCSCRKFKVHKPYSIILKDPLLDMGSRPMVEIILYDVIIKVPAQYYLTKPALGVYTGWSFYEHKAITSPRLLQAWQPGTWGLHMWNIQFLTSDWDEQPGFLQRLQHLYWSKS